jgi:hypothetical protein
MTLTELEQQLVSGDSDAVIDFADSDECIIIDHRAEDETIFEDVAARLPEGYFQYEYDGEQVFSATCRGVTTTFELEYSPGDRYRALRFINSVIRPDYEMKIMRCYFDADTHSFLLRPGIWWSQFAEAYPEKMQELFVDIDETTDFH